MWPWINLERVTAIQQAKQATAETVRRTRDDQANQIFAVKEKIRALESKNEFLRA
jgi:hypothetical protein